MKIIFTLSLITVILGSCNQGPKHPQANLINQNSAAAMTDQAVLAFADSIDADLKHIQKNTSLIYHLVDQSIYVEQYSYSGTPVLYIEYTTGEDLNTSTKKYYLKNDSLILVTESSKLNIAGKEYFEDKRTYFRNNVSFKKESRSAPSTSALNTQPYQAIKPSEASDRSNELTDHINILNDAINGNNQFEMVFDNIILSPNERYIVLKSKVPNSYSASIAVKNADNFIDSILTNPQMFKDEKLNIKWEIKDKEAVYVPVAANVTSAKGLKR